LRDVHVDGRVFRSFVPSPAQVLITPPPCLIPSFSLFSSSPPNFPDCRFATLSHFVDGALFLPTFRPLYPRMTGPQSSFAPISFSYGIPFALFTEFLFFFSTASFFAHFSSPPCGLGVDLLPSSGSVPFFSILSLERPLSRPLCLSVI